MIQLHNILKLPPRALGFGLWWMWIYLAILSPTFAQSPLAAQPMGGAMFSFMTIVSGAIVYAVAIPMAWKFPQVFRLRVIAWTAAAVASVSTAAMAFSGLFGGAGGWVFMAGSLIAGAGISVLYLQWGACYTRLDPNFVAPCTVVSFLLAIVGVALMLDRGLATSVVAIAIPLAAAALLPFDEQQEKSRTGASEEAASPAEQRVIASGAKTSVRNLFPLSVVALILVFSFAFGLFRVLLSPDVPGNRDMGLLLLCSAGMAAAMLAIIMAFSVSLGWDSIIYLALPLIAAAALVLSVVDFGDRSFVWAIVVAAIRVADLIMWMIFASLARQARGNRSPIPVFALGKLLAQVGVLVGIATANVLAAAFNVESLLLPAALAFLVLVTTFGSIAALKGRIATGGHASTGGDTTDGKVAQEGGGAADSGETQAAVDGVSRAQTQSDVEASATQARLEAIARQRGLSPRETEIFALLARGRTIPYIADELVLANSTVTTHVRGLYRKLDVHNRQELLDFVESRQ